jgi:NitT/TauT family transport system permease protein
MSDTQSRKPASDYPADSQAGTATAAPFLPGGNAASAADAATKTNLGGWRRARGLRIVARVAQVLVAVVVLGAWELLARVGIIDPFFFSRPSDIFARIWEWTATGFIFEHLAVTLYESFLAFMIGAGLGIVLGFLLARVPLLALVFDPYIKMLNAMPRVVLAPIFLLWFGLGVWSKVALGVTIVFFVVFFNTYQGVREVDRVIIDNARMLGASERQLIRHVLIPSAMIWIFSSLHVSVGFAIVGAVVGEYLGASRGAGYLISQAEGLFDTTGVFAGMVILMLFASLVLYAVGRLERRLLRWKPRNAPQLISQP